MPRPIGASNEAAAAALVYVTAYQALTQWGDLPPSVVLVSGASGGVGVASLQLGNASGHTMLALSRGTGKHAQLKSLGAAAVFDPTDPIWRKQIKEFLKPRRVDLAIDNIGGSLFSELLDTLGEWGMVSVVGRLAGPTPQFNTVKALLFRRLRIGGVAVGTYTNAEKPCCCVERDRFASAAAPTPNRSSIKVFPFDQLPSAFAHLAKGPLGKVLIAMGTPIS